jgi:transglutaminase-like putative cysteine protease
MRIRIRHETGYDYDPPAASALQLLRMTPRSDDAQFVRRWRVEVDADARMRKHEDAHGNIAHIVFVDGPLERLRILIEGEVETQDTGGLVRGTIERQPEALFLRQSRLTAPSPELARLARGALASQGGDTLAALHALCRDLRADLAFDTEATHSATTAAEAFAAGKGVCQDFAHIFLSAARVLGVPARYVSGYYLRSDTADQDAGHAWAEAHLPSLGWIAFDPANGHCATDRYVRVAVGRDYLEAAPVRGSRAGGGGETLSVALRVEQGRATVEG